MDGDGGLDPVGWKCLDGAPYRLWVVLGEVF